MDALLDARPTTRISVSFGDFHPRAADYCISASSTYYWFPVCCFSAPIVEGIVGFRLAATGSSDCRTADRSLWSAPSTAVETPPPHPSGTNSLTVVNQHRRVHPRLATSIGALWARHPTRQSCKAGMVAEVTGDCVYWIRSQPPFIWIQLSQNKNANIQPRAFVVSPIHRVQ